jgi:hypothetical protein
MDNFKKQQIIDAINKCNKRRRQVICRYIDYSNKDEDFNWLREKDYIVTNYPEQRFWEISW